MPAEQQYVIFELNGQPYGAPIHVVREVNHLTPVTRLPNTPAYVEGVIDLRGEVLPVINLRRRLGLPVSDAAASQRLMVLSLGERSAGVVVDGVDQVFTLAEGEIIQPDSQFTVAGEQYVTGVARVGERLVVLLDLTRLVTDAA